MPRRYYFAPVRGLEGNTASGIGRGIEQGVEVANRNLQQRRENKRQDELDDRRRLFDELEIDEMLTRNRGGRGEVPTRDVPIRAGEITPRSEGPRFLPEVPRGGDPGIRDRGGMMDVPDFGGMEVSVPRPDSRYQEVGPEGFGYVMTPEAIEEEDYLRARGREAAERGERVGRLGPIAGAIAGGDLERGSPEFGEAALRMSEEGYNPFSFEPREEPYQPTNREDYFRVRGRDPETGRSVDPRSTGGARDGRMSEDQAMSYLESRYATEFDLDGYPVDFALGPDEMLSLARDIAAGRDVELPPAPRGGGGGDGGGRPLTPEEVQAAKDQLKRFPEDRWEEVLRANGATEEHIQQIIEGEDGGNGGNPGEEGREGSRY